MKYGVRNDIRATIKKVKESEIMSQIECTVDEAGTLTSIISTDSLREMDLKPGDKIRLLVKAIHVIPAKD